MEYEWSVSEDDIGETSYIGFTLTSERPYRRYVQHNGDDHVNLFYRVLPEVDAGSRRTRTTASCKRCQYRAVGIDQRGLPQSGR